MAEWSVFKKTKTKTGRPGYSREKIMNTLDLNAYGVQEMNKQEMVETDGGLWKALFIAAAVHIYNNWDVARDAFRAGAAGESRPMVR